MSLLLAFGVLTRCTNEFNCTVNDCTPCQGVVSGLAWHAAAQAAVVVAAAFSARLRSARRHLCLSLSIGSFIVLQLYWVTSF